MRSFIKCWILPILYYWVFLKNVGVRIKKLEFKTPNLELRRTLLGMKKVTSRQRSGKGAVRKRFPLQKRRWEKNRLTIRYLNMKTYRKPNEQLFCQ